MMSEGRLFMLIVDRRKPKKDYSNCQPVDEYQSSTHPSIFDYISTNIQTTGLILISPSRGCSNRQVYTWGSAICLELTILQVDYRADHYIISNISTNSWQIQGVKASTSREHYRCQSPAFIILINGELTSGQPKLQESDAKSLGLNFQGWIQLGISVGFRVYSGGLTTKICQPVDDQNHPICSLVPRLLTSSARNPQCKRTSPGTPV